MTKTTLQDCLKAVIDNRGVTPHKRGTEWQNSGIPVLSANNVKTSGLQKIDEIRFIPEAVYSSWMKIPLERGDIILTSEAPAGEVYYWDSDEKIVLGQRLYGLKVKDGINSKYLKYYLQSSVGQKAINGQQSGSTVFGISAATFPYIVVNLLEKEDQDAIADLLYAIDSKISNNNAICVELEAMTKLIYDYWFVQFDFPGEDGKPYKSSGGKMVWNEELKREIPEGWEAGHLSDLGQIIGGATPSTDNDRYYTDNGIAWATPKDLSDSPNMFFSHGERDITNDGLNSCSAVLMPKGTVLMTSRAPIGYLAIANNEVCTNQGFKSIVPNKDIGSYYTYFTLAFMMPYIKRYGVGSTFSEVSKQDVENIPAIIPPKTITNRFNNVISASFEEISGLESETGRLASLRDFLLPMLMNGQVKVRRA